IPFQGIAFKGGGYFEATFAFSGTQSGDAVAFWMVPVEFLSGYIPETTGASWPELDVCEFDESGSLTKYGTSLHNWYNQGAGNLRIDEPHILASSPVTIPSGSFGAQNSYGVLIV